MFSQYSDWWLSVLRIGNAFINVWISSLSFGLFIKFYRLLWSRQNVWIGKKNNRAVETVSFHFIISKFCIPASTIPNAGLSFLHTTRMETANFIYKIRVTAAIAAENVTAKWKWMFSGLVHCFGKRRYCCLFHVSPVPENVITMFGFDFTFSNILSFKQ